MERESVVNLQLQEMKNNSGFLFYVQRKRKEREIRGSVKERLL